jgi:hypothetical protein
MSFPTNPTNGQISGNKKFDSSFNCWRDINEFSSNNVENGYQKLPSGIIIQWGIGTGGDSTTFTSFPIQFPNACLNVTATPSTILDGTCNSTVYITAKNISGFTNYKIRGNSGNQVQDGGKFFWMAIGY